MFFPDLYNNVCVCIGYEVFVYVIKQESVKYVSIDQILFIYLLSVID